MEDQELMELCKKPHLITTDEIYILPMRIELHGNVTFSNLAEKSVNEIEPNAVQVKRTKKCN